MESSDTAVNSARWLQLPISAFTAQRTGGSARVTALSSPSEVRISLANHIRSASSGTLGITSISPRMMPKTISMLIPAVMMLELLAPFTSRASSVDRSVMIATGRSGDRSAMSTARR